MGKDKEKLEIIIEHTDKGRNVIVKSEVKDYHLMLGVIEEVKADIVKRLKEISEEFEREG